MTSSRFNLGSTSVGPQEPFTSLFYGSMNGPGFKTMLIIQQTNNSNVFIGFYCCLLVKVQPLSLTWAGLHDTENLWALFQGPIVEFRLSYPIFYLRTSKFSPQQFYKNDICILD